MKIAYLISAHKDPKQLKRMILALQRKDTHFFIHLDAKVNKEKYVAEIPPPLLKYLTFTEKRYYIQWGGFNQVLYQKELLRTCLQSDVDYDRIFILTAQDYPLWSNEQISKELERNPYKEYIIGLNISDIKKPSKIQKKIVLYHFFRDMTNVPYKIKKFFSGASRIWMHILPIRKKPYIIIDGRRWDIWQSSAYMCITSEMARFILQELLLNKKLINYFRYSFAPDEMVIPTIIFNSPYRDRATAYKKGSYDGLKSLSAITYFNYDKKIQTFTFEDYDELKRNNKMFARKFVSGISDTLMDKLDAEHKLTFTTN